MPFWLTLLLFVGSVIISELLRPKPEFTNAAAAGLGEFKFPTATEGRPIPVIWGTAKLLSPNVIWYGNLFTVPIIEIIKYKKNFKTRKKRVVRGHRYFIDMHMALCHGPIDSIAQVFVQDRPAFAGTGVVDLPDFFGGDDKGGGLGGGGTVNLLVGNDTDPVSPIIDANINLPPTPGFRRVANVFLNNFEIGNDQFIDPFNFTVVRIPTGLGSTTPIITNNFGNSDANPAEVIFELLTEHTWGAGISPALIDTTNFKAVADTLASESFGVSLIWDSKKSVENMILDIVQQIDAVLFNDIVTGLFTLTLIRDDLDIPSLPVLDQDNISSLESYSRGALDETVNEVKVVYTGRLFEKKTAQAHELANFNMQGEDLISSTFQYPGINDSFRAADVAFRELRTLSFPLARIKLKANREAFNLRPGDAFKFTWPPLGIVDLVMRVNGVGYGTLDQGFITIDSTQDIFTLGNTIWAEPQPTDWVEPVNDPAAAAFEDAFSAPFHIVRDEFSDFGFLSEEANMASTVMSPFTIDTLGYRILTRDPPEGFSLTGDTDFTTPNGTITNDYVATEATAGGDGIDNTATLVITNTSRMQFLEPANAVDILQGAFNLMFVDDIDLQAGEIMSFETFVDNLDGTFTLDGVHRGMMDTTPKTHLAGVRVWFASFGMSTPEIEFTDLQSIELKYLSRTLNGTLAEGLAVAIPHTFTNRTQRPYAPGDFAFNDPQNFGALDGGLEELAALNMTWAHRDRQERFLRDQGDASVGPEADVDYQLRIRDEDDVLIRTEDFSPGSATTTFDYSCVTEAADSSIAIEGINNIALHWPGTSTTQVFAADSATLNSATYDEKTIEFKIRTSSDITTRQIIWEQGDQIEGINMYIDAGNLRAGVWSDSATTPFSEFSNPIAILPNTKYNFAFVFDNLNSRIRLYINGILVDDRTGLTLDTLPAHSGTFNSPVLGRKSRTRFHDGNDLLGGSTLRIDTLTFEVRQWNTARTTTEIDTNQNADLVGTETDLVLLWEISEGDFDTTTVTDETANSNDGTVSTLATLTWVCVDLVLNETLGLQLDSRFLTGTILSHQFQERLVVRAGWGYGYGDNYGGAP